MHGTTTETEPSPGTGARSMTVTRLTASLGAELSGVDLADVARSDVLFAGLRALLLEHKVLFLRDQDISRADHVALARRFGPLEDHPVARATRITRGSYASTSLRTARPNTTRTATTATGRGGGNRPWGLCCAVSRPLRWVATPSG